MDSDLKLALKLDRELNGSHSSPVPAKKFKKSHTTEKEASIVSSEWEITDPNPDIHMLFQVFNKKYFWGRLDCVEVKWSQRMYS
uniref:Unkown protein n=1 Tax=Riptortus pedestris TaxID=329032 RepID=R4WPH9_RIPPE|nr:unkown protein [Riptortus pedestris]